MKKFIMTSPYQPKGTLEKGNYRATENQKLLYNKPTSFPIITAINGYVNKDEEIEIIVIISDYENAEYNYKLFQEEVSKLSNSIGFSYKLKRISVPYNNYIDTELDLFGKLIDCVSDNDTLFACLTYGTKPFPIVQVMALNYALRIKKNVNIECVIYGAKNHNNGEMEVYDITSLIYIDETVRLLAEQEIENPLPFIKNMLK